MVPRDPILALWGTGRVTMCLILLFKAFWDSATPIRRRPKSAFQSLASLMLVSFSAGIAIGSASINYLLKGAVSARYSTVSVIAMGVLLVCFYAITKSWTYTETGQLLDIQEFLAHPMAILLLLALLLISIAGGMFVVPLYAFLTTKVAVSQASRSVAANNLISSMFMVVGALIAGVLGPIGVPLEEQLLISLILCIASAWLGYKLYKLEKSPD